MGRLLKTITVSTQSEIDEVVHDVILHFASLPGFEGTIYDNSEFYGPIQYTTNQLEPTFTIDQITVVPQGAFFDVKVISHFTFKTINTSGEVNFSLPTIAS